MREQPPPAASEMRAGPSEPPCRGRFQTTVSGLGERPGRERHGKGGARLRQVSALELNNREPLITCRKRKDVTKTGGESLTRDKLGGDLLTGQAVAGMEAAGTGHRL